LSYQTVFDLINAAVLPAWLALVLAPRWRYTQPLAAGVTVPVLAAAYVVLLAAILLKGEGSGEVDFTAIEGVQAIFAEPAGAVAGWAHYLAFDLFVGAWVGRDAARRGVPHLLVVPCLVLCFLAGPAGYLLYRLVRAFRR
jgi:hypothetical protein